MTQTTKQEPDCITGVNPSEILGLAEKTKVRTHGLGCWGNPRVVMGVRVDSELKKQFTAVSKRIFGSTCNPIESFMATIVASAQNGVNFGTTVEIGKIVIERNLRERRKLEVERADGLCEFAGCCEVAIGRAVWLSNKREYTLCKLHLRQASADRKNWRVLGSG
jgi:hypothetical protein